MDQICAMVEAGVGMAHYIHTTGNYPDQPGTTAVSQPYNPPGNHSVNGGNLGLSTDQII
ncbi:MAG: hypothetical protein ACUVT8_03285 [Armatimonadota bacterium]